MTKKVSQKFARLIIPLVILIEFFNLSDANGQIANRAYSMFGLGQRIRTENIRELGMGGAGISHHYLELGVPNNPSLIAYNKLDFVMSFKVRAEVVRSSSVNLNFATKSSTQLNYRHLDINLTFPLGNKWNIALGTRPISAINYHLNQEDRISNDITLSTENWGRGALNSVFVATSFVLPEIRIKSAGKTGVSSNNIVLSSVGVEYNYHYGLVYQSRELQYSFDSPPQKVYNYIIEQDTKIRKAFDEYHDILGGLKVGFNSRYFHSYGSFQVGLVYEPRADFDLINKKGNFTDEIIHGIAPGEQIKSILLNSFSERIISSNLSTTFSPHRLISAVSLNLKDLSYIPDLTIGLSWEKEYWSGFQSLNNNQIVSYSNSSTYGLGLECTLTNWIIVRGGYRNIKNPFLLRVEGANFIQPNTSEGTIGFSLKLFKRFLFSAAMTMSTTNTISYGVVDNENATRYVIGLNYLSKWLGKRKIKYDN
ncbi:MAG: hypothetical protein WBA74_26360 [Cyclobacteriaceae bacterium]